MLLPFLTAVPSYRVVDLGAPPKAEQVMAVAVNHRGEVLVQVAGYPTGKNAQGQMTFQTGHAYLWRNGAFLDFGEPKPSKMFDPPDAVPTAFNDFSVAVGTQGTGAPVFMSGLTDVNPFIWRGKSMDDLGSGWASIPKAINNSGDIVGDTGHRGFARLHGKLYSIETLSHVPARNYSTAVAINDHRLILGNSTYGGTPGKIDYSLPTRPFTIDGNRLPLRMRPVPLPKGVRDAAGAAINDAGTVLMQLRGDKPGSASLVLLKGKTFVPLRKGTSAEYFQDASLNAHDEVVATAVESTNPYRTRPLLWRNGTALPFPSLKGWTFQTATGVNDRGQICGTGLFEGKTRAYLLTPIGTGDRSAGSGTAAPATEASERR